MAARRRRAFSAPASSPSGTFAHAADTTADRRATRRCRVAASRRYAVVGLLVAALADRARRSTCSSTGARKRAAAKGESFGAALLQHHDQGAHAVGWLPHAPRHRHHPDRPGRLGDVRRRRTIQRFRRQAGSTFEVGGVHVRVRRASTRRRCANGDNVATANARRHARRQAVGTVTPGMRVPEAAEQTAHVDAARSRSPASRSGTSSCRSRASIAGRHAIVNVKINPLIGGSWAGFILTILGSAAGGVAEEG